MSSQDHTETADAQRDPGPEGSAPSQLVALGGWLFRHRTALPLPVVLVLLLVRAGESAASPVLTSAGAGLIAAGELVRLWAVRHIGAISRTRADRLGPLVATGPFGIVRNPLYLGNLLLWTGFAVCARLLWMVPLVLLLIGFEYHAIVRWEERLLLARRGREYRDYLARVPRWVPAWRRGGTARPGSPPYTWTQTLHSERGTIIAIVAGLLLLALKLRSS